MYNGYLFTLSMYVTMSSTFMKHEPVKNVETINCHFSDCANWCVLWQKDSSNYSIYYIGLYLIRYIVALYSHSIALGTAETNVHYTR